jgi:hypothetical protein
MDTHLPPQWRQRLLAIVNGKDWLTGKPGPEQMRLLEAWQRAEGGTAKWNPLNTTLHLPGWYTYPDYNSAMVTNFTKATYGVMATAATLINGHYNGILGWLQAGSTPAETCVNEHRDEFTTWGTNPDTILGVLSGT